MILLAWRLALRDLRGRNGGLLIVLLCLGVGVASIAGIFSLRAALDQGIAISGRAILGGDLALSTGLGPALRREHRGLPVGPGIEASEAVRIDRRGLHIDRHV